MGRVSLNGDSPANTSRPLHHLNLGLVASDPFVDLNLSTDMVSGLLSRSKPCSPLIELGFGLRLSQHIDFGSDFPSPVGR